MISQLTRLCNFLGAPLAPVRQTPPVRLAAPDQIDMGEIEEELAIENNLTTIVERIMARNGMNATLQRPTYFPLCQNIFYKLKTLEDGKFLSIPNLGESLRNR